MGNMSELDAAIANMTKQLEATGDKDKIKEMEESMDMMKKQAEEDPAKIDELIQAMNMMSMAINDPSAMFEGMGEAQQGQGGSDKPIKIEIIDHFAETNAAIREAKQTKDIDTLERVLKERAEHKSPLYFDAEKTLMSWKQTKCKNAIKKALDEEDVETLKEQLEYAERPDVYMTGTNKKGQTFSDALVIRARDMVAMKSMSEEDGSDWFIKKEMDMRKQYGSGPNGELSGSQIKSVLEDYRVTHKTPFYFELLTKAFVMQMEELIFCNRERQAMQFLDTEQANYGMTEQSPEVIRFREQLAYSGPPVVPVDMGGMQMGGPPPPQGGMQMGGAPPPQGGMQMGGAPPPQRAPLPVSNQPDFRLTNHHQTPRETHHQSHTRNPDGRERMDAAQHDRHRQWIQMVKQNDASRGYVKYWKEIATTKENKGPVLTDKDPMFANPDKTFNFLKMSGAGTIPKSMIPSFAPDFIKKKGETHIEERQAICKKGVLYYFKNTASKGAIPLYNAMDIGEIQPASDEKLGEVYLFTVQTKLPRRLLDDQLGCMWQIGGKTLHEAEELKNLVKYEAKM